MRLVCTAMGRFRTASVAGAGTVAAGLALFAFLWGLAWMMGPDEAPACTPQQVEDARAARTPVIDADDPPRIQVDVDYQDGDDGAWYPKGESPALRTLVDAGLLPPVDERVGPEPCVVRGVDGIGRYGGTWILAADTDSRTFIDLERRLSATTLVRFSPQGYPLVAHVAKSFQVSDDYREFTFQLRRGMRWSDGQPFTADDILYWWEFEANDKHIAQIPPPIMRIGGETGRIEKLGDYAIRFTFPKPNGLFLPRLARFSGREIVGSPAHYLKQYHPAHGDREKLDALRAEHSLQGDVAAYRFVKQANNPDHPRLWPWICHRRSASPPFSFVRNPYYWMVDEQGNQLPYIDRVHTEVRAREMIVVSAANGELSMQRDLPYSSYTLLMRERERGHYEVLHWYPSRGSDFVINLNLNLRTDYGDPDLQREMANKHALLNDKRFRQALSLAIDRQRIIDAEYHGQTKPAQNAPGPGSYFYEPTLLNSFTDYDPARANRLLDEAGLTGRDSEGHRTFPDGSPMVFYLNLSGGRGAAAGKAQFVIDDWERVGVRATLRIKSDGLFYTEKAGREHAMNVSGGSAEFFPILNPFHFVPIHLESNYAPGFAVWYYLGGLHGRDLSDRPNAIEPPPDHPLRRAMLIYQEVCATGDPGKQREAFGRILEIAAENVWTISLCTPAPELVTVRDDMRNVPRNVVSSWDFLTPGNAGLETYYFEHPTRTPGAARQIRHAVTGGAADHGDAEGWDRRVVAWPLAALVAAGLLYLSVRFPYIGRRLLIMVPTLIIISLVVFAVIQLPPGSYVESRIMALQQSGDEVDMREMEELKERFHLDDPLYAQYARWLGLYWFVTFDEPDQGLLQGHLGYSMATRHTVNEMVGDRILLTFLISLGTIILTWAVAVPLGIYSAVRQYSVADHVLTLLAFIGMCVPSFLLALVIVYVAKDFLGMNVSGLFSSEYGAQPDWDWPKLVDLLKHIWVPVLVGATGTAGMIRVMRGNLLDELRRPYVTTAMAKGMRPLRLLIKYPVRIALNPFISGIGGVFPELISGGAIVAMVLSLPTVGPLMLEALLNEDMYLAGSMLMVLSLLGVLGTLVSDLLLLWLDPRIRFKGGSR